MTLLASLQVQREALIPYIATALINQLAEEEEPSLLLLDDYSCITQQVIHASLASLVECQLPHVHLILATRSDPPFLLARLRGHGQVLEIRAERLRCTPEETRLFLDAVIGIALYEPEVKEVTARTEGWLAGLQLLGLSLQGRGATETLLQELSGSQNYILDYLTDEVLGRQPVEIQTFLVHTSILERLSASLCDAVMECSGSQHILEHLERANLFTISLDAQRQWYR